MTLKGTTKYCSVNIHRKRFRFTIGFRQSLLVEGKELGMCCYSKQAANWFMCHVLLEFLE